MKKIIAFIRLWPELWSVPAGLLIWFLSPTILRFIDPTSAVFDSGVLQVLLYAIIAMLIFNGVVFGGIRFNFPVVFEFYKNESGSVFNNLSKWEKIKVLLVLYCLLLIALVLLASSLSV